MEVIVSIDPGKNGALAVIVDGEPVKFYDMPVVKVSSKFLPSCQEVAEILQRHKTEGMRVVIEQVGSSPLMGNSGAFNFGFGFGMLQGVCAGMGIPFETVLPKTWKGIHALLGKDKDAARLLAIKLYPQLTDVLKRKMDVDRADALLMGIAWRKLNQLKEKQL